MRTAGLRMNDVWAHRVLHERGVQTHRIEAAAVEIGVLVEALDLEHHGKQDNYRPYLHLTGELRSITPVQALPYEIAQVTYSPRHGEKVDAFYEFSDTQLVALTAKGYFTPGFVVPEQVTGIEWELPTTADFLVLAPSEIPAEGDAPVVFTRVHDIAGLTIDRESTGYDLAEYFADQLTDGNPPARTPADDEHTPRARSAVINPLFTPDELAPVTQTDQAAGHEDLADAITGGMSTQLQQAEAEITAEAGRLRAEREHAAGTTENLYKVRVAQALETTGDHPMPLQVPRIIPVAPAALNEHEREATRQPADAAPDSDPDNAGEPSLGS